MRTNVRNRRGFTLAELAVVLAVVAIVSSMVVSFIVILTQRNRAATQLLNVMQDISVMETMTDAWIENNYGKTIAVEEHDGLTCLTAGDRDVIEFSDEVFKAGEVSYKPTSDIVRVEFSCSDVDEDRLYYVKIIYSLSDKIDEQTYTFCVNPYVGEVAQL